jgi:hypothetical protein
MSALNKCSERYNEIKRNYPQSLDWFKNFVTATLIISLERMTKLEDENESNKIQDSLVKYYSDEIEERWYELRSDSLQEQIRKVLREERLPIKVLRRTNEIDREFKRLMGSVYRPDNICEYRDGSELFEVVTEAMLENLYFNTFYGIDDLSNEWEKIADFIGNYTWEKYGKEVLEYYKDNCNSNKMETNESDPKVGTGKKPKGSDRRLYTDENPKDTVSVKFRTKQDIVDTLNKESFKSRSHARQSQIINLIHQRLRVALGRAKDPDVKKRLKTAFEYIEQKKEQSKRKTQEMNEGDNREIKCECGWSWKLEDGGNDPYTCHKCGKVNTKEELTEKCWSGYTQKGMKTMFGKRYPNCVKKKKK